MPTEEQIRIKQEMLGNGITDHNGLSWLCSYMGTQAKAEPRILPEEKEKLQQLVIEEMQGSASLSVPLIADCGWGMNWLEAH